MKARNRNCHVPGLHQANRIKATSLKLIVSWFAQKDVDLIRLFEVFDFRLNLSQEIIHAESNHFFRAITADSYGSVQQFLIADDQLVRYFLSLGSTDFVTREFDTYESKKHPESPRGLIFFVKFIGYTLRDLAWFVKKKKKRGCSYAVESFKI